MPYRTSLFIITAKIPFLSNLLISLHHKSINGAFYTKTNIFICGNCLTDIPAELIDIPIKLADIPAELADTLTEFTDMPIELK